MKLAELVSAFFKKDKHKHFSKNFIVDVSRYQALFTFRCVTCKVKLLTKHVIMLEKNIWQTRQHFLKAHIDAIFVEINKTEHEFPDKIMLKSYKLTKLTPTEIIRWEI